MEITEAIKAINTPFFKDPLYRGLRLNVGSLLYSINNPSYISPVLESWSDYSHAEGQLAQIIPTICSKLSEEERHELNAAYVAFLRIRGFIQDGEAVSYNLVGLAVKWKLEREYTDYLQTKE